MVEIIITPPENESSLTNPFPVFLSDLVFNYIACARDYGRGNTKGDYLNTEEEDLAISIMLQVFKSFGYEFTRDQLLAEVARRT